MLPIKSEKVKKIQYVQPMHTAGKVRKFDQKLFDKYDVEARDMVKNILKDNVRDNENIYGEDMIFNIKPFPCKYLELQVFSKWDTDVFPYVYPFVFARKMKFSSNTLFLTFNKWLTELILFRRDDISNKSTRLKKYDRELIHYVTWGKTIKIKTYQLTPKLIREFYGEFVDTETSESIKEDMDI